MVVECSCHPSLSLSFFLSSQLVTALFVVCVATKCGLSMSADCTFTIIRWVVLNKQHIVLSTQLYKIKWSSCPCPCHLFLTSFFWRKPISRWNWQNHPQQLKFTANQLIWPFSCCFSPQHMQHKKQHSVCPYDFYVDLLSFIIMTIMLCWKRAQEFGLVCKWQFD